MLQLATHLADPVHARDAYLLAQALGDLTPVQWERLDLLYRFVNEALGHPEIVSSSATNLAGARLTAAQRLLDDEAPMERLRQHGDHASAVARTGGARPARRGSSNRCHVQVWSAWR